MTNATQKGVQYNWGFQSADAPNVGAGFVPRNGEETYEPEVYNAATDGEGHVDSFTVSKADHRKIMLTLNGYVTSQFDQASFPVTFNFLNRVFCIKNIRVGKPKGQYHEATVEAEGFAGVTS